MKTTQKWLMILAVAGLASTARLLAQDSAGVNPVPPAANDLPMPPLAYGVAEVLQLQQANVGDSTIIAYIRNSGNAYAMNAQQIIYLRQKGVSDAVVSMMLNQPKGATVPVTAPAVAVNSAAVSTATVAPTVTYEQPAPAPTYYYAQPYYYYGYGWYPPVSLSFGWRGGWHGGWHR